MCCVERCWLRNNGPGRPNIEDFNIACCYMTLLLPWEKTQVSSSMWCCFLRFPCRLMIMFQYPPNVYKFSGILCDCFFNALKDFSLSLYLFLFLAQRSCVAFSILHWRGWFVRGSTLICWREVSDFATMSGPPANDRMMIVNTMMIIMISIVMIMKIVILIINCVKHRGLTAIPGFHEFLVSPWLVAATTVVM